MKHAEHEEQKMLMKWWALAHKGYKCPEELLFAIPNGGQRNAIVGAKLKEEGVRAGVPDLFLAFPVRPYAGLFIEMKRHEGGRVSPSQKVFIQALQSAGYYVAVCRGFEHAIRTIIQYLRGELDGESNETTDRKDEGEAEC